MSPVFEVLLIAAVILGLYLTLVLFFSARYNTLLNKLLATFAFIFSVFYFTYYLVNKKWIGAVPFFAGSFTPLYYLTPAVCYLYVRCFVRDEYRLRKTDIIHFMPFFIHFVLMLPYLFSASSKKAVANALMQSSDNFIAYNTSIIPERFHVTARLVQTLIYLFMIWHLLLGKSFRDFVQKNKSVFPAAIRWIKLFSLFLTILTVTGLIVKLQLFITGAKAPLYQGNAASMFLVACTISLFMFTIVNPVILYGMPQLAPLAAPAQIQVEENEPKAGKTADAPFEKDMIAVYEERINDCMKNEKPYCHPDFNIAMLSKMLDIPQHHLAWIFKARLKKTFVAYRNELRVNYVKQCMQEGKDKQLTLEAIGQEAGFSSRSNFFTVFKNATGQSPMQYAEALRVNT